MEEILTLLILVVPGFVTITLALQFYGYTGTLTQFDKTAWSILVSGIIGSVFFTINNLWAFVGSEDFLSRVSSAVLSPMGMLEVFGSAAVLAMLFAFLLRADIPTRVNKFIYLKSREIRAVRPVWEFALEHGGYLLIESNGTHYQGWIGAYSTSEEVREILLMEPGIVNWDDEGEPKITELGSAMLIPERAIANIVFLETESSEDA